MSLGSSQASHVLHLRIEAADSLAFKGLSESLISLPSLHASVSDVNRGEIDVGVNMRKSTEVKALQLK